MSGGVHTKLTTMILGWLPRIAVWLPRCPELLLGGFMGFWGVVRALLGGFKGFQGSYYVVSRVPGNLINDF